MHIVHVEGRPVEPDDCGHGASAPVVGNGMPIDWRILLASDPVERSHDTAVPIEHGSSGIEGDGAKSHGASMSLKVRTAAAILLVGSVGALPSSLQIRSPCSQSELPPARFRICWTARREASSTMQVALRRRALDVNLLGHDVFRGAWYSRDAPSELDHVGSSTPKTWITQHRHTRRAPSSRS
jgi:hypothetical protein